MSSLTGQVTTLLENDVFASDLLPSTGNTHIRDQLIAINDFICQKMESTPDIFISEFGMSQLTAQYQALVGELQTFVSDGNVARLGTVKTRVDQYIMPLLWTFAPVTSPDAEKIVNSSFASLRLQVEQSLKLVRNEEEKLKVGFDALGKKISVEEENLRALGETLALQKAEALAVTAKVQQEYAEQETKRSGEFSTLLEVQKDMFVAREIESKEKAEQLIAALTSSRDDAARLVEAVGDLGTTGNYRNIANREAGQANVWRRVAVVVFALGMIFAAINYIHFLNVSNTTENLLSAVLRLFYAIVITAPAWYAARESARHRSNSDRARQTELELAALGPFIELMPEDKKISIREKLITTYFGNTSTAHVVESPLQVNDLLKTAVDKIKIPGSS